DDGVPGDHASRRAKRIRNSPARASPSHCQWRAKEPGIRSSRYVKGRRYQALLRPRWRCNLRPSVDVLTVFYRRPTPFTGRTAAGAFRRFLWRGSRLRGHVCKDRFIVAFWSDRLTEIMDSRMILLINWLGWVFATNNRAQASESITEFP